MLTYGSLCSGIEAASVAFEPLGLTPTWFSEIADFPSFLLSHKWPHIKNLGDIRNVAKMIKHGEILTPDILIGGTPCQSFSFAGLRGGMTDERGKLVTSFVETADEIDHKRLKNGQEESVIIWENVKGVLSTKDNSFGCFLGLLSGEEDQLIPPGGKWSNAGCVFGPRRVVAWRVLNSQYFGVPQRRRRVYVVASARKRFDPTKILFESEGLFRSPEEESRPYPTIDCGIWRKRQCNQWVKNGFAIVRSGKVTNPTILEIERMQGFPDYYTDVPWLGNNVLSERYSSLGNSMTVSVIRWLGSRVIEQWG